LRKQGVAATLMALFICGNAALASDHEVIDLTHVLGPDLPDFHLGNTAYSYKMLFEIEKDGYGDGVFTVPEHYGTHVDAPLHFFENGQPIDKMPAQKFIAPGVVIDVRKEVKADSDYRLTIDKIVEFEKSGKINPGSIVLVLTGWADRFADARAYRNADAAGQMHYPALSKEATEYLADKCKAVGIGVDTISADYGLSRDYPAHKAALSRGLYLIENLANLDKLPARGSTIFVGPLKIKNGTGSPARILAVIAPRQ
jgi:kynurenine formamidase